MSFRLLIPLFLIATVSVGYGQETHAWHGKQRNFELGTAAMDHGLYGEAIALYRQYLEEPVSAEQSGADLPMRSAGYGAAYGSLVLDLPESHHLVQRYITQTSPDPLAARIAFDLADIYYRNRQYAQALDAYRQIPLDGLTRSERIELKFKTGYAHFVQRQFAEASREFSAIKEEKTMYYYPAHYYNGMCSFFAGEYRAAEDDFRIAGKSDQYRDFIPLYIAKIYHAQGDYDRLISYAMNALGTNPANSHEIRLLLGQAYFEKGDYASASPHLRAYETASSEMTSVAFYQLAFCEYQTGHYQEAVRAFQQVYNTPSELGFMATFFLGKCYLNLEDKPSARAAFASAGRSEFKGNLKDEANFHYGQLSAELQYTQDAIDAFESIDAASPFYKEAQQQLALVFLNTRDFERSIQMLDEKGTLTPNLQRAYQALCVSRGIQLYNDQMLPAADRSFEQSFKYPLSTDLKAQALFWQAEIAHAQGDTRRSIDLCNQYLSLSKTGIQLPVSASPGLAHYTQGYNYLKRQDYPSAELHFKASIDAIRALTPAETKGYIRERVLPDAILRTGDCVFKRNRYQEAMAFYRDASSKKMFGYDYALYQEAIMLGLLNQNVEKIVVLDQLISEAPGSEYVDDAYFQKAITLLAIDRGEKAVPVLAALTDKYPGSELYNPALLRLGLISYNNGDIDAAIGYYTRVLEHKPTKTEAQDALAALEEIFVRDMSQPERYFAIVDAMPEYSVSMLKKDSIQFRSAEIRYEEGDYPRAISGYTEYLKMFPNGSNALKARYQRAESHAQLGDYTSALADYKAILTAGNSSFYLPALEKAAAITYHDARDFEQAFDLYDQLATKSIGNTKKLEASIGALRSAYRSNKPDQVLKYASVLEQATGVTPDIAGEMHYYAGKAQYEKRVYDAAVNHFNALIRLASNAWAAEGRYLIAKIYFEQDQPDLAEQLCQNTMKESANYPEWVARSLILLSDIALQRKDYLGAKAPLEAILEHFTGDQEIVAQARQQLEAIRVQEQAGSRIRQDTGKYLQLDYSNDQ